MEIKYRIIEYNAGEKRLTSAECLRVINIVFRDIRPYLYSPGDFDKSIYLKGFRTRKEKYDIIYVFVHETAELISRNGI